MSLQIFKERLKAKIKTLGVNNLTNQRIDAYAATLHKKNPDLKDDDTAGHDTAVDELNELIDLVKVAKDDDRIRNLELKLKEKTTPPASKKGKEEEEDEDEEDDEENEPASGKNKTGTEPKKKKERVPAYVKAIMDKLDKLENEKKVQTIESKIKGHEKLKDIPADFYEDYVKPEKEEDIDTFAEKVSTKYATFKQIDKNDKAKGLTKPVSSDGDNKEKADPKEVDAILDNLMPGTKAPATK